MTKKIKWPKFSEIHTIAFDFDGVLTDNRVWIDQDGKESVVCNRADGLALDILRKLKKKGLVKADWFILSTEKNSVVRARAKKLKIDCYQGVGDKLEFLKKYFSKKHPKNKAPFKGLIYLGNDLNDLKVIETGCFSVVPRDAHQLVIEKASTCLQVNGGDGFVRRFVEEWIKRNSVVVEDLFQY